MIGTKHITEDTGGTIYSVAIEERSVQERRCGGTHVGPYRSDHADISNEQQSENLCHRNSKDSRGRFVRPGLVGT